MRRSAVAKVKVGVRQKKRERAVATERGAGVYHGKQAKTGNSLGLRFERALFHTHPEFSGDVEAKIIGPGRMLGVAVPEPKRKAPEENPVLSPSLTFLPPTFNPLPNTT